ncbi:hypothetical protein BDF21DRAFT_424726 [Thamnidium elegans]|nr:hypothetical protein BDF21DRAFT_424726 [Thamnidium elegans]
MRTIMSMKVIGTTKVLSTTREMTRMRSFTGMNQQMTLQMFIAFKTPSTIRILAGMLMLRIGTRQLSTRTSSGRLLMDDGRRILLYV